MRTRVANLGSIDELDDKTTGTYDKGTQPTRVGNSSYIFAIEMRVTVKSDDGSATVPLYGSNVTTWQACQALCAAHQPTSGGKKCEVWSWCGEGCGGTWGLRCFGRLDGVWTLHEVRRNPMKFALTSYC